MELVKGRECGSCSVCCVVLNVDTPEFQKMPNVPCAHLRAEGGCAIHATRYPVCAAYHCAWRYLGVLSEDWRPDKSGVLIDFHHDNLPAHYPKRPGIRLTLVDIPEQGLSPMVLDYVGRLVAAEVPVVIAVRGPKGHYPAGAFVNDALKDAVAARDLSAVGEILSAALKNLATHQFNPVVHRYAPPS